MKTKKSLTGSALGAVALSSLVGTPAQANTFVVNDCDGFATALETANNSLGADTIVVNCDLQISSAITIEDDLVISGTGELIFSGSGMIGVGSSEFTLDGLDISGSTTTDAIYAFEGGLELKNLKVENFHSERGLIRTHNSLLELSEIVVHSSTVNDFFIVTDGGTINAAKMKLTDLTINRVYDTADTLFRGNDTTASFDEIYVELASNNNAFVLIGGSTILSNVFVNGNFTGTSDGLSNVGLVSAASTGLAITNSTFTGLLVGIMGLADDSYMKISQSSFFYNYANIFSPYVNSDVSIFGNFFGDAVMNEYLGILADNLRSFGANVCESNECFSEYDLAVADAGLTVPVHWNTDDYSDWVPGTMFALDSPLANVIPSDVYSGLDSGSAEFQSIFGPLHATDIRGAVRGEFFDVGATEFTAESTFEVQFVSQGRNYRDPLVVDSGESVNLPRPSRQGYEFKGWYLDDEFSVLVPNEFTPLSDTVLYAKWSRIDFDVVLHLQNGDLNQQLQYVPGDDPLSLPTPIRQGYEFLGWFSQENGGTLIGSSVTPSEDLDLYAQWKQIMVSERFTESFRVRFGTGKVSLSWLMKQEINNHLDGILALKGEVVKIIVKSGSAGVAGEKLVQRRVDAISKYLKAKGLTIEVTSKKISDSAQAGNEFQIKFAFVAEVPLIESAVAK